MIWGYLTSLIGCLLGFFLVKTYYGQGRSRWQGSFQISKSETLIVAAFMVVVVTPSFMFLAKKAGQHQGLTFNEYYNGYETRAVEEEIRCSRDGPCIREYNCDPYQVCVPVTTCNSKGNCSTRMQCHTEYHDCPYATYEYNYYVETTLGTKVIDRGRFSENPERWRRRNSIPASAIRRAGTGPHPFWEQARIRLQADTPNVVTEVHQYKNYLLASDQTILDNYRGLIDKYQNLLPDIVSGVYNFYLSDKFYDVDLRLPLPVKDSWVRAVNNFNSVFGRQEGDLHFVAINASSVDNPDEYITTLKAYWQEPESNGRNTLSKNTLLVVVGVSGRRISWARAVTGMPNGNENMLVTIREELIGLNFHPVEVIGRFWPENTRGEFGKLHEIAISNPETRFVRSEMSNFNYLLKEVRVSVWYYLIAGLLSTLFSAGAWIFAHETDHLELEKK